MTWHEKLKTYSGLEDYLKRRLTALNLVMQQSWVRLVDGSGELNGC